MSIITISRDSYSKGLEIAALAARQLGFTCMGPDSIADEIQGELLSKEDDRLPIPQERFLILALFRKSFYRHMLRDNIVYHGQTGHLLLSEVPNVLKVRILADREDRIREEMRREALGYAEAKAKLAREDLRRNASIKRHLPQNLFDLNRFDLGLNLHNIPLDKAVETIVDAARINAAVEQDTAMLSILTNLWTASRIEARLLKKFFRVSAKVEDAHVSISIQADHAANHAVSPGVHELVEDLVGPRELHIETTGTSLPPL